MQRFVRALLFLTVSVAIGIIGCGRSNIEDYTPITDGGGGKDGDAVGPDGGPTCGPATCPNGCCDAQGTCRAGTDVVACGGGGQACNDCIQQGFMLCDATKRACGTIVQTCDASNCPSGCCTTFGGMQVCLSGSSSLACGSGGKMCTDCSASGQVCDGVTKTCTNVQCGPNTCAGCCNGNSCVSGIQDTTCGMGGVACSNCTAQMQFCNAGKCFSQPPKCGPQTCPNGCCDSNNNCVGGTQDTLCGKGGAACTNCAGMGQVCTGQACVVPPCNANNCSGCCLQNNCLAGFANNHCGSGGAQCADCTAQMSTCNTLANPRVCNNMQMTCPAPYGMCSNNVTTPVLSIQKGVCSTLDLQDARAACLQGWGTQTCNQFYQFINQQKPACGKCLNPFNYNFQDLTGIFNCTSPCNSAQCNHATGCVADCSTQSCSQCPMQQVSQCQTSVKQPNGQCFQYVQGAQCVGQALFGQCSFCNPAQYFGNFGNWLQGVGQHFCGP